MWATEGQTQLSLMAWEEGKLKPIVCRAWKICMWTISESHTTELQLLWPERTFPGGWSNSLVQTVRLSPICLPDFMDWEEKKPMALKIWWSLRKGYVLNIYTTPCADLCVRVDVCVCGFEPLFEVLHSTLAITSYQGLYEGEGKEEAGRWK